MSFCRLMGKHQKPAPAAVAEGSASSDSPGFGARRGRPKKDAATKAAERAAKKCKRQADKDQMIKLTN